MIAQVDFLGQARFFSDPIDIIQTQQLNAVRACLAQIEAYTQQGYYAVGYVAYEAAPAFNPVAHALPQGPLPLLWFAIYDAPTAPSEQTLTPCATVWQPNVDHSAYCAAIRSIKDQIHIGNTYQTNYTLRLQGDVQTDPYALYCYLKHAQRSDYCAYLDIGEYAILSASPELFFHYHDGKVRTKPMKGTAARGATCQQDECQRAQLFTEKNRAENMMIVDLLRNDLNRIARTGTVRVDPLFEAEKYPTVWQLTSTVHAEVPTGTSITEIFTALFPCGSITGAPKLSTMRLITELETAPRGVYCGAIGLITPNQEAIFNVAIRTLTVHTSTGRAEYGVGGGITWDSTAEDEYQEVIDKARILTDCPLPEALLETLRLENGMYFLLDRHLQRLQTSAAYFDFVYDDVRIRTQLAQFAEQAGASLIKVRLLLNMTGDIQLESHPCAATPQAIRARLAPQPICRAQRFLYHKTTRRDLYPEPPDGEEYLLMNEEGQITEFVHGNVAIRCDDVWYTPPVECGLLAGTHRAELIAQGRLKEALLYPKDIDDADEVMLINSVCQWKKIDWQPHDIM